MKNVYLSLKWEPMDKLRAKRGQPVHLAPVLDIINARDDEDAERVMRDLNRNVGKQRYVAVNRCIAARALQEHLGEFLGLAYGEQTVTPRGFKFATVSEADVWARDNTFVLPAAPLSEMLPWLSGYACQLMLEKLEV